MEIITERLRLKPFDIDLIDAALAGDTKKICSYGYIANEEWPEPDLIEALPIFKDLIIKNGVNGFNSWIITDKATNDIIGSLGFIGNPDENGNIEIGFGVIPSKRRLGYCVESVEALIKWAFEHDCINRIVAQCDCTNFPSKKILEKIGFAMISENEGLINWVLKKTTQKTPSST